MREILVIRFGALGDLVLATVVLDALHRQVPRPRITWVTKQVWGALLADDPRVDRLVLLREGESVRSLGQRIGGRFDLVLDAHANLRSRALGLFTRGARTRRLHKDTAARWIFRHGLGRPRSLQRRLTDRYLELLGGELPETGAGPPKPSIHIDPATREGVLAALPPGEGRLVAVAVGATHAAKRWPVENFRALVCALHESGYRPIVVGGPREQQRATDAADETGATIWNPSRSLAELAALISGCEVLVGCDSGLLHLAEASGTPVVGLFGPTVEAWGYFPWRDNSIVLEHELDCRPCSRMGEVPCHLPEQLCMTRTGVDDVLAAVREVTR